MNIWNVNDKIANYNFVMSIQCHEEIGMYGAQNEKTLA